MATFDSADIRQADNAYIRKTMRKPLLDREYEVALAKRWREHDDHRAMHELVMAYARLVVSAAGKIPALRSGQWRFDPGRQYWPDAGGKAV